MLFFVDKADTTSGIAPTPEDNKCQRLTLTPRSHRPQVAGSRGDQVEYSDNVVCFSNSYEYELNADLIISVKSRLKVVYNF